MRPASWGTPNRAAAMPGAMPRASTRYVLRKAIAAEMTTWNTIDSETSAPTRRATAATSLPVAIQLWRPVERVPIGATRQRSTAQAIGATANAM